MLGEPSTGSIAAIVWKSPRFSSIPIEKHNSPTIATASQIARLVGTHDLTNKIRLTHQHKNGMKQNFLYVLIVHKLRTYYLICSSCRKRCFEYPPIKANENYEFTIRLFVQIATHRRLECGQVVVDATFC